MSTTLLTAGLACVIAAIVGGGLKAFGLELPTLGSTGRQALLATFGIILIVGAYSIQESSKGPSLQPDVLLFDTKNNDLVFNGPPDHPAEFTIPQSYYITSIWNYHYNEGRGVTPGNISLRRRDGKVFGPWEVTAADVTTKINWECQPKTTIPAGTYTIVDSEDALWSWNDRTGRRGMSKVKGHPAE
jgi:hypothetical protein